MKEALTLPAGLTLKALNRVKQRALDPSAKKWLKALKLVLTGGRTAEEIASRVDRSRPWLFARRRILFRRGLAASLDRDHGGGRPSATSDSVEEQMKSRFRSGESPRETHSCLNKEKHLKVTIGEIYRLRQKWDFARKQTGMSRRKKAVVPRPDPLHAHVDPTTMDMIAFTLQGTVVVEGIAHIKLGILWILGWRAKHLSEEAKAGVRIPTGREVAGNLGCSPMMLYKVARLWNEAQYNWDDFIKAAFSKEAQRMIRAGQAIFLHTSPRPTGENGVLIKTGGDRRIRFRDGSFREEDPAGNPIP